MTGCCRWPTTTRVQRDGEPRWSDNCLSIFWRGPCRRCESTIGMGSSFRFGPAVENLSERRRVAGWHGGLVELGPRQHLRHGIILRASEPPEGVLDILQQLYDISARTGCGWRQPLSTPPPENGLGQKPFHFTPCSLKLPGVVVPPRQLASSEQRPTRPSGPRFFCLSRFQIGSPMRRLPIGSHSLHLPLE